MSEYIWKDTLKIVTREWTRGELLQFWGRILEGGDLQPLMVTHTRVDEAILREHIACQSTVGVYHQTGKGWKELTDTTVIEGIEICIPPAQAMFANLPVSLADGWIAASEKENGDLFSLLNFTRSPLIEAPGMNGSGTISVSEPSPAS